MTMSVNLLVVMDDISQIKVKKDSSIAMLWAAARRGWTLWYAEQDDLYVRDGAACGRLKPLQVFESADRWHQFGEAVDKPLAEMQVVLMRKDPPFDMRFIYTTYILERAEEAGVLVVNKPQSLRDCNEKFFATFFPHCMAPTLVASDMARVRAFIAEQGDVIVKPMDGMGGTGIFRLQQGGLNIGATLETLTLNGTLPIIGVIPESEVVLQSSNAGSPAIHLAGSDVAGAYLDVVGRFLGETIPLRYVDYEKPGLFKRFFGGK